MQNREGEELRINEGQRMKSEHYINVYSSFLLSKQEFGCLRKKYAVTKIGFILEKIKGQ